MEGKEASAGYVNKQVIATAKGSSNLLGTPRRPYSSCPRAVPAEGTGAGVLIYQRLSVTGWGLQGVGQACELPTCLPREVSSRHICMQEKAFGI